MNRTKLIRARAFRNLVSSWLRLAEKSLKLSSMTRALATTRAHIYKKCADDLERLIADLENPCPDCGGDGLGHCKDPQCWDSTWDHYCGEGGTCSTCMGTGEVCDTPERTPHDIIVTIRIPAASVDEFAHRGQELGPLLCKRIQVHTFEDCELMNVQSVEGYHRRDDESLITLCPECFHECAYRAEFDVQCPECHHEFDGVIS